MAGLMVNVDHVATLRQARRGVDPDPLLAAALAELAGCDGIIVHLREDRRHIQDRDLELLRRTVKTKLNLEMAAVPGMVNTARKIKPEIATLVPEKREELTTEGGLDRRKNTTATLPTSPTFPSLQRMNHVMNASIASCAVMMNISPKKSENF